MKNFTEIIAIIDESGSMSNLKSDVIGGFNGFIEEQKKVDGDAILTTIMFSSGRDKYYKVCDGIDLKEFEGLNESNYRPHNMTSLYDAIGRALSENKKRIKSLSKKDRPDRTILAILTDGLENASREYDKSGILKKIKKREDKGWLVIYLGANQDAFAEGSKFGVSKNKALTYTADSDGMAYALGTMSKMSASYRSMDSVDYAAVAEMDINEHASDTKKDDN